MRSGIVIHKFKRDPPLTSRTRLEWIPTGLWRSSCTNGRGGTVEVCIRIENSPQFEQWRSDVVKQFHILEPVKRNWSGKWNWKSSSTNAEAWRGSVMTFTWRTSCRREKCLFVTRENRYKTTSFPRTTTTRFRCPPDRHSALAQNDLNKEMSVRHLVAEGEGKTDPKRLETLHRSEKG